MEQAKAERYGVLNKDTGCWCTDNGVLALRATKVELDALLRELGLADRSNLEVRPYPAPAAPEVCRDCGAAPCDCSSEVWVRWFKRKDGSTDYTHGEGRPRRDVIHNRMGSEYTVGPVQRISDPPYAFGEAKTSEVAEVRCNNCDHFLREHRGPDGHCVGCDCQGPRSGRTTRGMAADRRAFAPPFTAEALARALFEVEMLKRGDDGELSEAERCAEVDLEKGPPTTAEERRTKVGRVLDVMWQKTRPAERQRAEELAGKVVGRMSK